MEIERLMKRKLCNHCLGRQAAQLLSGYTNEERGRILRTYVAMLVDSGKKLDVNANNFHGIRFHNQKIKTKLEECFICGGVLDNLHVYVEKIIPKLEKMQFDNFLIGTKQNKDLTKREERLWEESGIEWTEPIKADINRIVGSSLEKALGKKANFKNPEILVLVDIGKKSFEVEINPVFIYGEYNKLVRGIPQTKWPSGKYKTSVEQKIAKDFMRKMKGTSHALHGAGREDIDARCLGWRPFVLEISKPMVRKIDLKKIRVERGVKVRNLKYVDSKMVEKIKSMDHDKTYRALAVLDKKIDKKELKKLSQLKNKTILQETPERVMHRRANLVRKRKVKSIKWKVKGPKKIEFTIKAEAGTYIKELISGDKGRTYPSISQLLGVGAKCKELDVIKFSKPSK